MSKKLGSRLSAEAIFDAGHPRIEVVPLRVNGNARVTG
jgi:hypothetical protein